MSINVPEGSLATSSQTPAPMVAFPLLKCLTPECALQHPPLCCLLINLCCKPASTILPNAEQNHYCSALLTILSTSLECVFPSAVLFGKFSFHRYFSGIYSHSSPPKGPGEGVYILCVCQRGPDAGPDGHKDSRETWRGRHRVRSRAETLPLQIKAVPAPQCPSLGTQCCSATGSATAPSCSQPGLGLCSPQPMMMRTHR